MPSSQSSVAAVTFTIGVMLLGGCTDRDGPAVGSASGTGGEASTGGSTDAASGSGAAFDPTPWLGPYHGEGAFSGFGQPASADVSSGSLIGFSIHEDGTAEHRVERCSSNDLVSRYRWEPTESGELMLLPPEGETELFFGLMQVDTIHVRRFPCGELNLVLDGDTVLHNYFPGEACWVNRCEDPPNEFEVGYCEGEEPHMCG